MPDSEERFISQRMRMVDSQIAARDVRDSRVLAAMRTVPRHRFIPENQRAAAYEDGPLPIGHGQTISQPYVVASMTEHLNLDSSSRVLEIGTGCGYQTAVLAEIAGEVFSLEIVPELLDSAERTLRDLGYTNITLRRSNGYSGWSDKAPFDGIIVTAAAPYMPKPLVAQIREGGRMVIPIAASRNEQDLYLVTKAAESYQTRRLYAVRFVPMVGDDELDS